MYMCLHECMNQFNLLLDMILGGQQNDEMHKAKLCVGIVLKVVHLVSYINCVLYRG